MKRAIYIGDVRYNECHVFELNTDNNFYEMIDDTEIRYSREIVEDVDEGFIVFDVDLIKEEIKISDE
jgi:hypothetical protein